MRGFGNRHAALWALVAATSMAVPAPSVPAAEGSTAGHDAVNFSRPKYQVRESRAATIDVLRGTHGSGEASVDVVALSGSAAGTATPDADYSFTSDRLIFRDPIDADETNVPTVEDSEVEAVETVNLDLKNFSRGLVPAFPNDAVVSIVDNDGLTRIGVDSGTYEVFENNVDPSSPKVEVFVLRAGPIAGAASVEYETQADSATAGKDFKNVSGVLEFQKNQYVKRVTIPLINDSRSEGDETFALVLSAPTGGATLDDPSTATITIHDDDGSGTSDTIAPYTAFHQPLHGKKYTRNEATTLLLFMQDDEFGSGIDKVELAIRKKKKNGTCAWWNGTRFFPRHCSAKRWADVGKGTNTKVEYFVDENLAIFTLKRKLKRSTAGTAIKNYKAFSRGWDKAGNVQRDFIKGQNKNTFEVK